QRDNETTTGSPKLAAVQTLPMDGTTAQRWSLAIWPNPNGPYHLRGTYRSNPYQLTATAIYPMGGQPHSETIREACLGIAERDVNDVPNGPHQTAFRERMVASVNLDRRMTTPKSFGFN